MIATPAWVSRGVAILLLLLAVPGAGCGGDDPQSPTGSVAGESTEFSGGAPLEGVRIVLLDPATNAVIAVSRTDAAGRYRIDGLPPGRYYAAAGVGRFIAFETRDDALEVRAGRVTRQHFRLGDYPYLDPEMPPVSGQVLDEATGLPLPGAYVSIGDTDLAALFSGVATPWETVTDSEGRFELLFVPFFADPRSGALLGLYPVMATHPSYAPAATGSVWRRELLPLPVPPGATTRIELRLRPTIAAGVLRGRVEHEGRGVPDIPVGLVLVDTALTGPALTDPARAGLAPAGTGAAVAASARPGGNPTPAGLMAGLTTRTDAGGDYVIPGIPPGQYRVQVAYWPDDGWVASPTGVGPSAGLFTVAAGSETIILTAVLPAVRLLAPLSGSSVPTGRPRLSWSPFPGTEYYRVRFSNADGYLLTNALVTTEPSLSGPLGLWGNGDWVRWSVEAYASGRLVALSDVIATFVVRSRGDPGL